ncbi:hypothetical protein LA345_37425 (plasmid) [Burkholderia vietnamiensis]|uniref:Uncharacterized protein n=1 Tax=Burkholderia vietnamiensis (strain G4 / LMG 22486) TaxID=269482 RepID=A4JVK8_BURVG|nr:hypothetical protein Bcep1808_7434 [Burkholderia vietnamiensis G4]MCB4349498.1 hypothetical protein [Burkholderia vietnamiensis]
MITTTPFNPITGEEVLIALSSLGEDPDASRVERIRSKIDPMQVHSGDRDEFVRHAVAEARQLVDNEKGFEVGGVKFSAVRTMTPRPHWRLKVLESGEIYEGGTAGISNVSVPKMQADVEELFRRASNSDPIQFRAHLNLAEAGASADAVALAGAFQALYYTGKRLPNCADDLDVRWGADAVEAIKRHESGGAARDAGSSSVEEAALADALGKIRKSVIDGAPYTSSGLRGAEFKHARAAAMRFAPNWKVCVASYEGRQALLEAGGSVAASETIADGAAPPRPDDKRERAQDEFEAYDFGAGVMVHDHDLWDMNDATDFTKLVYLGYPEDNPDSELHKVTFHVGFRPDASIDQVYALEVQSGNLIGQRPAIEPIGAPSVARDAIGNLIGRFSATSAEERATIDHALTVYGFLIARNEHITLSQFADRIAASYDTSVPQNAAVVAALRDCAARPVMDNSKKAADQAHMHDLDSPSMD